MLNSSVEIHALKDKIIVGVAGGEYGVRGFLDAYDAKTGQAYWTHDMFAAIWGSPVVIDGKVYLGDEDGDVVVMQAGKEKKLITETNMGSSVYSSPVPANGALFLMNRNQLFSIATGAAMAKPTPTPAAGKGTN